MPRQIANQAPYLRRYARALTGSQASGDQLVETTMERLLSEGSSLASGASLKVGLYRALHHAWASQPPELPEQDQLEVDRRLQTLTPDQRAALLLTAMEGFSLREAADILGLSQADLKRRLDVVEAELASALSTDVVIIEDEPIIALDLTRLVRELGHRVIGTAATRAEAIELAAQRRPGLILADVRLADGSSGMDAAADIFEGADIPVVFITAFPEHLLSGEGPEPAFLITKPFREEAVRALISQALFFHVPQRTIAA